MTSPSHDRSVVKSVPAFFYRLFLLFTMDEQRRRNFQDGQAGPSRDDDGMSSSSDDDCDVAGASHTQEPDDAFCTAVVQKILPALVQALGSEKVREVPAYLDSDSSDVDMDSVPLDGSHAPVSGVSSPVGFSAAQAAHQVNATTQQRLMINMCLLCRVLGLLLTLMMLMVLLFLRRLLRLSGPFYAWSLMTRKPDC